MTYRISQGQVGACLPVGTAPTHMYGLCMTFTQAVWPEPRTTMEAPSLALPPGTSILRLSLSFLTRHLKGDRLSNLLSLILSLKICSLHSREGYFIAESTVLHLSGTSVYGAMTLVENLKIDGTSPVSHPWSPAHWQT